jgi:hypothetical protein
MVGGCEGELTEDEFPVHLHELQPSHIGIRICHFLQNVAFVEVVFGGVEGGWRGKVVVSGVMSWVAQERNGSGHDRVQP